MTAVTDYIFEQLEEQGLIFLTTKTNEMTISISASDYLDIKRLAKEMEKQQIIDALNEFSNETLSDKFCDKYITATYGSKGSDEVEKTNSQRFDEFMQLVTSSQTEISDEEIEKGAWENPCLSRQDVYELFDEVFKDKTLEGMFKISASKEVKQFKERLRQLAKEKYREQLKQTK